MKNYFKSVITITLITVTAAVMLALSHNATKDKIAYQERQEVLTALKSVLPFHNNEPDKDVIINNGIKVFVGKKDNEITGYAVNVIETSGYGGAISVLTGVDVKGAVTGVAIIYHSETPGLGDKIMDKSFLNSFTGKRVEDRIAVKKDGGDIEQFSGATISPRAVAKAAQNSLEAVNKAKGLQND